MSFIIEKVVAAGLLLTLAGLTEQVPAVAQTVSNLDASVASTRLYDLSNQVNAGVGSNQLTDEEAAQVRAQLNQIEQMRNSASVDGYTAAELQQLMAALDNANSMLVSMLSNGVNRPIPQTPVYVTSNAYASPSSDLLTQLTGIIQSGELDPYFTQRVQARMNQLTSVESQLQSGSPYMSSRERNRLARQANELRRTLSDDLRKAQRSRIGWRHNWDY